MLRLNSRVQWEYFTTQFWWATITYCIQKSFLFPPCEWYITCLFCIVCRAWGLLLWLWYFLRYVLVFELKNNMVGRFAITHICGGFLDGKVKTRLNIYFLFWCSTGCVRGLWQERGVLGKECEPDMFRKAYSNR